MANERIELGMSFKEIMLVMAKGNPGALTVLVQLVKRGEQVDPDALIGPMAHILMLDTYNIYEDKIWMLYKDLCGEDISKMIAVLRSCQLGLTHEADLHDWIEDGRNHREDMERAVEGAKKLLPKLVVTP